MGNNRMIWYFWPLHCLDFEGAAGAADDGMISSQIVGEFTAVLLIYAFDMRHFDVEVFLRAFKRDGPQGYAGACVSLYKQKDTIWNLSLELSRNLQNKITQGLADVTILIYIYIFLQCW